MMFLRVARSGGVFCRWECTKDAFLYVARDKSVLGTHNLG